MDNIVHILYFFSFHLIIFPLLEDFSVLHLITLDLQHKAFEIFCFGSN